MVQKTKADVYIDGERNKLVLIKWHCWKKNKTGYLERGSLASTSMGYIIGEDHTILTNAFIAMSYANH